MAKIDKAGIYVDAYCLFGVLYKAQFDMPKKDRCVIAPRLLDHCERLLAEFGLAFNVEEDRMMHIDKMLAEYEMLKVNCRFAVEMGLIRNSNIVREVQEYVVRLDEGIRKWRGYVVANKDK